MDEGTKDKLTRSPGENRGKQNAQEYLHSRTGRAETKGKTLERMERRGRKGSSSAGVRRWREFATGRKKLQDIFRQAKAQNGL